MSAVGSILARFSLRVSRMDAAEHSVVGTDERRVVRCDAQRRGGSSRPLGSTTTTCTVSRPGNQPNTRSIQNAAARVSYALQSA